MKLSNMAKVLRSYGLTVVETPGWATRGYAGQDLVAVAGVLWHHTATNRFAFVHSNAPTLSLCINGRADLPGPLCQIVLGRDGTVYLTAAGVANHAGRGQAAGVPRDLGNHYLIGIEMESSGVSPWDWTDHQKRVAPYLGAALELGYLMHLPPQSRIQIAHYEYSAEGKIDPAGWPGQMDGLRAQINATIRELQGGKSAPKITPQPGAARPATVPPKVDTSGPHWNVEKGDNLYSIAAYYGIPLDADRIAKYNGVDPKQLAVGQKIYIPAPLVWIVDPGDTWAKIDAYYGYAPGAIQSRNPGVTTLRPGQVLKVWG